MKIYISCFKVCYIYTLKVFNIRDWAYVNISNVDTEFNTELWQCFMFEYIFQPLRLYEKLITQCWTPCSHCLLYTHENGCWTSLDRTWKPMKIRCLDFEEVGHTQNLEALIGVYVIKMNSLVLRVSVSLFITSELLK